MGLYIYTNQANWQLVIYYKFGQCFKKLDPFTEFTPLEVTFPVQHFLAMKFSVGSERGRIKEALNESILDSSERAR